MADSSPNTSKGFTPKPNSLVSMKLHNKGGGFKIKKVWKQKPIQTKSTTSLTAITSYWSEWKQYHTLTKGSNNVTSLGCKVAGREAKLAVLVWERLPGVPEGGPGHRGPPAHYGANDGEVAVVPCEITHVCDHPSCKPFCWRHAPCEWLSFNGNVVPKQGVLSCNLAAVEHLLCPGLLSSLIPIAVPWRRRY